jgi:quercetin dioxygenase-like cupin family protein
MRTSWILALVSIGGAVAAGCADHSPTAAEVPGGSTATHSGARGSLEPPPPIATELLTGRHRFTDEVAARIRLKPEGRPRQVVEPDDLSRMAVLRITVQPGARFPWHIHPGPVLVAVTQGALVYVYADDCVKRRYPTGTALVDPGSNVHYAFNPTGGETVLIATFFDVSATGLLTIPVNAKRSAALDAKCGAASTASHTH